MSLITETQLKLRDADVQLNLAVEHIGDEDIFRSCKQSHKINLIFWHESLKFVSCALLN